MFGGEGVLQIGVCDDRSNDIGELRDAMSRVTGELSIDTRVDYYQSGEELLEAVRSGERYGLLVLDIYMSGMDGVETARRARELMPEVQLAFLTMSREFAADAFELNAIHYVIKPVTEEKLRVLFERYFERTRVPVKLFGIQAGTREYQFPLHRIEKIQSSNKGVAVYLDGESEPHRVPATFISVEQQLEGEPFLRISRGLLVNMDYILSMDRYVCRLKDGTEALVSRRERSDIRRKYYDYLFGKLELRR